jgi:hypothetical protein
MGLFHVSLDTANRFYAFGWYGSLGGVAITLIAVMFLMLGTRIRDRDFESQMANLNLSAAQARENAATLEARAAELQNEAAKAKEASSRAGERAAKLELALEREGAARMPRTISTEQRALIVELLSSDEIEKGHVLINPAMDGEAWQFGAQILSALKEAGFPVSEMPFGERALAFSIPGAFLQIKDSKNQPRHAGPILEVFKRAGISFTAEEETEIADINTVVIAISSHP